jgi:hypothetical protein
MKRDQVRLLSSSSMSELTLKSGGFEISIGLPLEKIRDLNNVHTGMIVIFHRGKFITNESVINECSKQSEIQEIGSTPDQGT